MSKSDFSGDPGYIDSYEALDHNGRPVRPAFGERPAPRPREVRDYKELSPLCNYAFEHDDAPGNEWKFKFIKHIDEESFLCSSVNGINGKTEEDHWYYTDCGLKANCTDEWHLFNWVKELEQ